MKQNWRTIYAATLTTTIAGLGAIAYCVVTSRPTGAVAGLAVFLLGLICFRMSYEVDSLQRRRDSLANQERLLQAERGVFERDTERARRELADQDRATHETLNAERDKADRQLTQQRDAMVTEFANHRAKLERAAFAKAWDMCKNGVAPEHRSADVIVLPVGTNAPTIIGTGTSHQ